MTKSGVGGNGWQRRPRPRWLSSLLLPVLLTLQVFHATALELPLEFTLQASRDEQQHVELVWASETVKVIMGGARPEFRLQNAIVLGYPRETPIGGLRLRLTPVMHKLLEEYASTLSVYLSGRRLDSNNSHTGSSLYTSDSSKSSSLRTSAAATTTMSKALPLDPAGRGSLRTERLSYELKGINVSYPYLVEVVAEVTVPIVNATTNNKMPLILFLHGRHSTCYQGSAASGDSVYEWPCPRRYKPIPSHSGYRYIADRLASQGYLTVSIAANGVNGQDDGAEDAGMQGRSLLVRHHLDLWSTWNSVGGDPWKGRFVDKVNLNQVVLVGHSRGGEGVHRAAVDASSDDPYRIVGLVTYGPTAFTQTVTPDVHSVTILPTCDGDVSDLQGQAYVDVSRDLAYSEALRSAVVSVGTNHNFFNTEWTPGLSAAPSNDDWYDDSDSVCGSKKGKLRLTPSEQQAVGAAYTAALVKLATRQDANMLPLLDGSYVRPASIGRADVAVNTVGGAKNRYLYRPGFKVTTRFRNGIKGQECTGRYPEFDNYTTESVLPVCGGGDAFLEPHWITVSSRVFAQGLELQWRDKKQAGVEFVVPASQSNFTGLDWVNVRIMNDPYKKGATFRLVVRDKAGRNATLSSNLTTVESWPGQDRYLARTLRGSLGSARSSLNLDQVVAISLVAQATSGRVWVLDVAAGQARIQRPLVLDLPQLSIESKRVLEADGLKRYGMRIIADRPLTEPGSIWVEEGDLFGSSTQQGYLLELSSGADSAVQEISYDVVGDDVYSNSLSLFSVRIQAVSGVVTGESTGRLTIAEDDPAPKLSVAPIMSTAVEGESLQWTLTLSAPTAGTTIYLTAVAPATGKELLSSDIPSLWWRSKDVFLPDAPAPLSELLLSLPVRFDYGATTVVLSIPLINDGKSEGDKVVVFQNMDYFFTETSFETVKLIGRVKDGK
jgi:dienelactone hydrolase